MSACRSVPGHPAHQEVEPSVLLTGAVHGNDVRMFDRRGHPGLPFEPRAEARVCRPLGGDELQRDGSVEPELGGSIDDTHPATPGYGFDATAGESRVQDQIEHCRECDGARSDLERRLETLWKRRTAARRTS